MKKSDEKKIGEYLYDELAHSDSAEKDERIVGAFVKTLQNKRLLERADAIVDVLSHRIREAQGELFADVTVKNPLSDALKREIEKLLTERYGSSKVTLREIIDERIIGGIRIKVRDEVFDATIRNNLMKLKKTLRVK